MEHTRIPVVSKTPFTFRREPNFFVRIFFFQREFRAERSAAWPLSIHTQLTFLVIFRIETTTPPPCVCVFASPI